MIAWYSILSSLTKLLMPNFSLLMNHFDMEIHKLSFQVYEELSQKHST